MSKSVCLLLFAVFSTCSFAQHYIGVKGALGYSSIYAIPDFKKRDLQTLNYGLLYRYEHAGYAALQIETNYINKGFIREIDTITMTPETTERITSFELPVMAQGFIRLGIFRPYLTGGVTAGYILQRKVQEKGRKQTDYEYDEYDRRFEYGIAGGGGLGITVSRVEIQTELRYSFNFSFLRTPVIFGQTNKYLNPTQFTVSVSLLYRIN
ncbi:MAG: PorT family protein [Prevotellaceae bacterium]|jgi:hypothetical protein|nr:PorT family protein [Prevotellaceae bacterium]